MTPRDFDLSPYFQVLKINFPNQASFDYRRIRWAPVRDADDDEPDTEESATG